MGKFVIRTSKLQPTSQSSKIFLNGFTFIEMIYFDNKSLNLRHWWASCSITSLSLKFKKENMLQCLIWSKNLSLFRSKLKLGDVITFTWAVFRLRQTTHRPNLSCQTSFRQWRHQFESNFFKTAIENQLVFKIWICDVWIGCWTVKAFCH